MMEPILAAGLLALGALTISGAAEAKPQAAPYAQQSLAGSMVSRGITGLNCRQCAIYRTPLPGETVILNPQPLPPKASILRR